MSTSLHGSDAESARPLLLHQQGPRSPWWRSAVIYQGLGGQLPPDTWQGTVFLHNDGCARAGMGTVVRDCAAWMQVGGRV